MEKKRLVLLVEGDGDVEAVPALIGKVLPACAGAECLFVDSHPIRVGNVGELTGKKREKWIRMVGAAGQRNNVGAVLAVLDGDISPIEGKPFCAGEIATCLAERAKQIGAGQRFSLACVFAVHEYESWLIAGISSLAGVRLPNGESGVDPNASSDGIDTERSNRGAKEWLRQYMPRYKETVHQVMLTKLVDLNVIRARQPRSFLRLEKAVVELVQAVQSGAHIVSPIRKTSG